MNLIKVSGSDSFLELSQALTSSKGPQGSASSRKYLSPKQLSTWLTPDTPVHVGATGLWQKHLNLCSTGVEPFISLKQFWC